MKRIVGSAWYAAHLRVLPHSRISRENGELRTLPLGELPPLQLSERHHHRCLLALRCRSPTHGPMSRGRGKNASYETQEETIHLDLLQSASTFRSRPNTRVAQKPLRRSSSSGCRKRWNVQWPTWRPRLAPSRMELRKWNPM